MGGVFIRSIVDTELGVGPRVAHTVGVPRAQTLIRKITVCRRPAGLETGIMAARSE